MRLSSLDAQMLIQYKQRENDKLKVQLLNLESKLRKLEYLAMSVADAWDHASDPHDENLVHIAWNIGGQMYSYLKDNK